MKYSVHSALAKYLSTRTALVNLLPEQTSLGNSRAASIFVRRPHQDAIQPYILIQTVDIDDFGNTSEGVLTRKGGYFTISVCGLNSSAELEAINAALISEIIPLRQLFLPTPEDENSVWVQYLNVQKNFFHDGMNAQGNEEGLPCWKILINTAFNLSL